MKSLILLLLFLYPLQMHSQETKTKFWHIDRAYGETGIISGYYYLYRWIYKTQDNNARWQDLSSGIYTAWVMGNSKFQAKARFSTSGGGPIEASYTNISLLAGPVCHFRHAAMELAIGLGYQEYELESYRIQYGPPVKTIGFAFEAGMQLIPVHFFGMAPFLHGNITARTFNIGAGCKIMFGKVGYTKKEYSSLKHS